MILFMVFIGFNIKKRVGGPTRKGWEWLGFFLFVIEKTNTLGMCRDSSFHEVCPCVKYRSNMNEELPRYIPSIPCQLEYGLYGPNMYPTSPIHHSYPRHVNKVRAQVSFNTVTYTTCILKKYSIFDSTNVENGVGFTFRLGRPYIVIITRFLGLAKPNLVHVDSNPIGESDLPL
jgi:hypothetical protein